MARGSSWERAWHVQEDEQLPQSPLAQKLCVTCRPAREDVTAAAPGTRALLGHRACVRVTAMDRMCAGEVRSFPKKQRLQKRGNEPQHC